MRRLLAAVIVVLLASCAQVGTLPTPSASTPPPAASQPAAASAEEFAAPRPEPQVFAAPPPPALPRPTPLIKKDQPADWWFVFKFNTASFPHCGGSPQIQRTCSFGGTPISYKDDNYGQQFVYASSQNSSLQKGDGCVGETMADPLGATFGDMYDGSYFYVVWNDQFKDHPKIQGCSGGFCAAPWAHSKGMLAWNSDGDGIVLQVTTPSWPGAASRNHPRLLDGNTLGCVLDNNVLVSQHFFALKLVKDDVVMVLQTLQNSSVATDPQNASLVNNGGPPDIQALVANLAVR